MVQPVMPRVGIGVPTYNRPAGLRHTLACLSAQTYPNIDILVSDNASPDPTVAEVVAEMAARDPRIRYVRQATPLGATGNFRFLLDACRDDYFMWAADDDEWAPGFVEACMSALLRVPSAVSAMTGVQTLYRGNGRRVPVAMPMLSPEQSRGQNFLAFLQCMAPGVIYGIHRREAVQFFLEGEMFDYYDCYFALRLIMQGRGVVLVPELLYTAGVEGTEYVVKTQHSSWGSGLRYLPFYNAARSIIAQAGFGLLQRVRLETSLALLIARLFVGQERAALMRSLRHSRS